MKDELNILNSLLAQAKKGFCRIPVLIAGEYQERSQLAEKFLDQFEQKTTIWVSGQTQPAFSKPTKLKANNVIGKEYQLIIYDIEYNFEPNLFAALSGTLCGGGLMLVLSPPVKNWIIEQQKQANWFTWRFIKILSTSPRCPNITTGSIRTESPHFLRDQRPSASKHPLLAQQALAIQKIVQVVRGHRNRPLVLLADRGRGKSAALGIAASQLLASGVQNILLTSPSMEACTIVFKHLKLNLASASFPKGQVITNNAALRFISPDSLVKTLPSTNLLLVDEAAGIPTATLALITQKYARIVFASTIHGYEGSGHCFSIKFFEHLDRLTPNWKKFELTSPVRWAQADPLEALSNQLFLFSSQEKQEPDTAHKISNPAIQQISAENLVKNEGLLNQLYALLSSAHYRTQPSDLLHLLNDANIVIFLMQENKQLIAAAFATSEGCLEQDIGKQIYLGNRRLKGNIIPQTLATHPGIENAVQHRYL
ncbi:MAG TPA: tRNA(Met) cytidine acetyltransferase, partial [Gammaproteobacteria bacterium]|nr:tRNA(Met) cytidine acetyltransferase [Gammaproteobacteria bacterium]